MRFVLDSLLGPIAHLLVGRGVLFPQAAERLKQAYVRAALPRGQTDSALSVLTGLQRRDLARLRDAGPDPVEAPPVNHLARLVALWQTDPAYTGRALDRRGPASFETLALAIRKDVHPRTMLDALTDAGTVTIDANDRLVLAATSYQPLPGTEAQLDYLARNAGDFLAASMENVLGVQPPHFERAVHYNGLSAQAVDQLKTAYAAQQMAVLQAINAQAASLQNSDPGPFRFRAGGYFYQTEEK